MAIWPAMLVLAAAMPMVARGLEAVLGRRVERRTRAVLERARAAACPKGPAATQGAAASAGLELVRDGKETRAERPG